MTYFEQFWLRPKPSIRPDKLYDEESVRDQLDLLEAEDADVLADWRERGVGPRWTTLPGGYVRYYGGSLLEFLYPDEAQP